MIQFFPQYQSESSTYYASHDIPSGQSGIIFVPSAAGGISLDIYANGAPCEFSIYVTNSSYQDAIDDADSVIWHPTSFRNYTTDLFTVLSALAGAYKIIVTQGNLTVKVRGK